MLKPDAMSLNVPQVNGRVAFLPIGPMDPVHPNPHVACTCPPEHPPHTSPVGQHREPLHYVNRGERLVRPGLAFPPGLRAYVATWAFKVLASKTPCTGELGTIWKHL